MATEGGEGETELDRRLKRLQEQVERVERAQRELEAAMADLDHQSRRISDRMERGGGGSEIEAEQARVTESQRQNRRDQAANSRTLEQLRAEREEVERRLRELRRSGNVGE